MKTREIPLSQGYVAIIDEIDYDRVRQFKWCASVHKNRVYAMRREKGPDGKRRPVLLHRFIRGAWPGMVIDHYDGNGLNNTWRNLNVASQSTNTRRRHHGKRVVGAWFDKRDKVWRSHLRVDGKVRDLGRFETKDAAQEAFRIASAEAGNKLFAAVDAAV